MKMKPCIVYVKLNEDGEIIAVNSSAFLKDAKGWYKIDSGYGDRYHHAQGNYFPKPIRDERGIYRYKLEDSKPVERTADEMDADYVPPVHQPSDKERITALEEENAVLLECLLEMSEIVYA